MASDRWVSWGRAWRRSVSTAEDLSPEPAIKGSGMNGFIRNRAFGLALMAASLVALVLSGYSNLQAYDYSKCQSGVTESLIQASMARSDAASQDRALDRDESRATALLIQTVFTATTSNERIAAYSAYAKTLEDIDKRRQEIEVERANHPLPEPPSKACA